MGRVAYADGSIEFLVQIIQNRAGAGGNKCRVCRTLAVELLHKKRQHLYIIENTDNNLCFSINLAHVRHPEFTDAEALRTAEDWQLREGLTRDTTLTLSDVRRFKSLLNRKIVRFYRPSSNSAITKFEMDFADRCFSL